MVSGEGTSLPPGELGLHFCYVHMYEGIFLYFNTGPSYVAQAALELAM